jgi:lactate racemase
MSGNEQSASGDLMVERAWRGRNALMTYRPSGVPPLADMSGALQHALAQPSGAPPLKELAHPAAKILILVDDHTRSTPCALVLPAILRELESAGVPKDHITILVAHGTHRLSTAQELRNKLGSAVFKQYRVWQQSTKAKERYAFVGKTSWGTPIWIFDEILRADIRIAIGQVAPNPYSGYSGGGKMLVPGAAALETIDANHSLVPLGFRRPGDLSVPARLDIDEAAAKIGLDFLVNIVMNGQKEIAGIFCGKMPSAFQAGYQLARKVYEVDIKQMLDFALVSSSPYDIDFYQATRAIEYADNTVKSGGSILLIADCPGGIGSREMRQCLSAQRKEPEDYLDRISKRKGTVTTNALGYNLARIKKEKDIYVLSRHLPEDILKKAGFMMKPSLPEALQEFVQRYGHDAAGGYFPYGAMTVPILAESAKGKSKRTKEIEEPAAMSSSGREHD